MSRLVARHLDAARLVKLERDVCLRGELDELAAAALVEDGFSSTGGGDAEEVRAFVGLDVHKATIAVAVAEGGRRDAACFVGEIENTPTAAKYNWSTTAAVTTNATSAAANPPTVRAWMARPAMIGPVQPNPAAR